MTTTNPINADALAARQSVSHLPQVQRIAVLQIAIRMEQEDLVAKLEALRVELAEIEDAMAKPKRERAPRAPKAAKPEQTAEEQLGAAFLALATPRTVDELAKALGVSRAKAMELAEDLITDGRAAKVRAGRGWRFQRATATEEKGAAQ